MSQMNGADDTASKPDNADQPQQTFEPTGFWVAMALLMLAAVIRIPGFADTSRRINLFFFISEALVILAVIYAAERMIAIFDGDSGLHRLDLPARVALFGQVMVPMSVAGMVMSFLSQMVGDMAGWPGFNGERLFLRGIDGIAFDQMTDAGRAFSATLAGLLMLFVIERGQRSALSFRRAGFAVLHHAGYLVTGIILCTLIMIWLSGVQDYVRTDVYAAIRSMEHGVAQNGMIALFAGSFACVRLLVAVGIFTLVLRASYRKNADGA